MAEYGVTIETERSEQDDPSNVRREVIDGLEEELGEDVDVKLPGRLLSAATDLAMTIGTVLAANPEFVRQVLRVVIDHPDLDVSSVSFDGDQALFIVDVDVDVTVFDVDVTVFDEYKGTTVYEASEMPREFQEQRLLEKINEVTEEKEYSYEDIFDK